MYSILETGNCGHRSLTRDILSGGLGFPCESPMAQAALSHGKKRWLVSHHHAVRFTNLRQIKKVVEVD